MKKILLTGCTGGLGKALALALAEKGYSLFLHYRSKAREAKELAAACREKEVEASVLQGDFSSDDGIAAFLEKLPVDQVGGYVHNAGPYEEKKALQTSSGEWMQLFCANLRAPQRIIESIQHSLIAHQASVVFIGASGLNAPRFAFKAPVYMLFKQALLAYTRMLAAEWAPCGVRVNMVSPGHMPFSIASTPSHLPMGRLVAFGEVVQAVLFLIDASNASITGQNIEVAGGVQL